LGWTLQLT